MERNGTINITVNLLIEKMRKESVSLIPFQFGSKKFTKIQKRHQKKKTLTSRKINTQVKMSTKIKVTERVSVIAKKLKKMKNLNLPIILELKKIKKNMIKITIIIIMIIKHFSRKENNFEYYENEGSQSQSTSQVILSLQEKLAQSEDTINSLIDENKTLKIKNLSQSSVISFVLQSLDSLTRSPITNNLINSAILSPSLEIIDKSDIKYIENDKSSKYMKVNYPSKDRLFAQFQSIVDFRKNAKSKVENCETTQSSQNTDQSSNNCRQNMILFENKVLELESTQKKLQANYSEKEIQLESSLKTLKEAETKKSLAEEKLKEIVRQQQQSNIWKIRLNKLVSEINSQMECPLLLLPMTCPMVTPSGFTIDEMALNQLISDKMKDPFDGKSILKDKIVNRFVLKIKEIADAYSVN